MHLKFLALIYLLLLLFKSVCQSEIQHQVNLRLLRFLLPIQRPNHLIVFIFSFWTYQSMNLVSLLMRRSLAYQQFLNSSIQLFYQSLQVLGPLLLMLLPSLPLLLLQFPNDHHLLLALLVLRELLVLLLIILAPFEFFIRQLPQLLGLLTRSLVLERQRQTWL